MEIEMSVQSGFCRRLGLMAAVVLAGQLGCSAAWADGGERGGAWLRAYATASERPEREAAASFLPEQSLRRPDAEDSRNLRRWSSEERQQLRRDVHDAGRDVYGAMPRHRH